VTSTGDYVSRKRNTEASSGNTYIWHRPEFTDRLDELGTFAECGAVLGRDGARTVSKWHTQYDNFPAVVCSAGERASAKKYLVKAEFADWLVAHEVEILERDRKLYQRFKEDAARVKKRIEEKTEDVRIAKSMQEKWNQDAQKRQSVLYVV
jgi:hypothetical protein